jgi:ADP-dependent NAD(P)H-hydrate dehydratase / NAD(P)H-hydrate epimerase
VLAGVCGALLAGGLDPLNSGSVGAFVHGLAGIVASGLPPRPISATDIVASIGAALSIAGRSGGLP